MSNVYERLLELFKALGDDVKLIKSNMGNLEDLQTDKSKEEVENK